MSKDIMEMAKRHRSMIMDVATAISEEMKQAEGFQFSAGDVLRLAAVSPDEQRDILAKYKGESVANMIIDAAKNIGAKNIADALDARDDEESLKDLVNRVMDGKTAGDVKKPWTEDDFLNETLPENILATLKLPTSAVYLNFIPANEEGPSEYHLTIFGDDGEFIDDRVLSQMMVPAFDEFARQVMSSLLGESASMAYDDAQEHHQNNAIHSAVTEVMHKVFTGNLDGLSKAG